MQILSKVFMFKFPLSKDEDYVYKPIYCGDNFLMVNYLLRFFQILQCASLALLNDSEALFVLFNTILSIGLMITK